MPRFLASKWKCCSPRSFFLRRVVIADAEFLFIDRCDFYPKLTRKEYDTKIGARFYSTALSTIVHFYLYTTSPIYESQANLFMASVIPLLWEAVYFQREKISERENSRGWSLVFLLPVFEPQSEESRSRKNCLRYVSIIWKGRGGLGEALLRYSTPKRRLIKFTFRLVHLADASSLRAGTACFAKLIEFPQRLGRWNLLTGIERRELDSIRSSSNLLFAFLH